MSQEQVEETAAAKTDSAEESAEELQEEVEKKSEDAFESVSSGMASVKSSVSITLGKANDLGGDALGAVRCAFGTVGKWKDEGTPLRDYIKAARLKLNNAYVGARTHYTTVEENVQDKLETSKAHTQAMLGNIGIEYDGIVALRRKHPEVLVGGATLLVAVPSLLAGKHALFRRSILTLTASAGVVYGMNWWERRRRAHR